MTEIAEILYYQRDRANQKIILDLVATHILEGNRKTLDRCILKREVQIILKTKKGFNITSRVLITYVKHCNNCPNFIQA